ncbi:hypothetical protein [Streptomyces sp. NPDC056061]|uniref:hypothetical protein n=1 Tax=Streptomyces sp. NPDC056061 TaxID=3345700 RepID=UPI0035DE04A3
MALEAQTLKSLRHIAEHLDKTRNTTHKPLTAGQERLLVVERRRLKAADTQPITPVQLQHSFRRDVGEAVLCTVQERLCI